MTHDFLSTFPVKAAEYLTAVAFLVSFPLFWKFLHGGVAAQPSLAPTREKSWSASFAVPDALFFHPGHAWARLENGFATVGLDDFAQRLVGAVSAVALPAVGAKVGQGEKAWSLNVDGRELPMLSPVDGTVVAVNEQVSKDPSALKSDPYGNGWLLKVEPSRPSANLKQLLSGESARRWVNEAWETLLSRASPELGLVAHDGGTPVDGIAQNLSPERWDELARKHFLT